MTYATTPATVENFTQALTSGPTEANSLLTASAFGEIMAARRCLMIWIAQDR